MQRKIVRGHDVVPQIEIVGTILLHVWYQLKSIKKKK